MLAIFLFSSNKKKLLIILKLKALTKKSKDRCLSLATFTNHFLYSEKPDLCFGRDHKKIRKDY